MLKLDGATGKIRGLSGAWAAVKGTEVLFAGLSPAALLVYNDSSPPTNLEFQTR